MTTFEIILGAALMVVALGIILLVVMQEAKGGGLNASLGGSDMMYAEGRSRSNDVAIARYTKYLAIAFFVLVFATGIVGVLF